MMREPESEVPMQELAGIVRMTRLDDLGDRGNHSALPVSRPVAHIRVSAGMPLQLIKKAMGHASARTSEIYVRPDDESIKQMGTFMGTWIPEAKVGNGGKFLIPEVVKMVRPPRFERGTFRSGV
jgi:hypothetical protein